MLWRGLITPYRGECYHIKEYSQRNSSRNARELFNRQHFSLQNAMDRTLGVLKKCFPIIGSEIVPIYNFWTQKLIVLAWCKIHNFLMKVDLDESLIVGVDAEIASQPI